MAKGFKKFPHDWRKPVLGELKGIHLSVWLYHWSRSGPDETATITLDQMHEDLPYARSRIVKARRELREAGWLLVEKESYRDERGHWTVPVYRHAIPATTSAFPVSAKRAKGTVAPKALTDRSAKRANGKGATTVDTNSCCTIDTAEKKPVHTTAAVAAVAVAAASSTDTSNSENGDTELYPSREEILEFLDYFYQKRHGDTLAVIQQIDPSRIETDAALAVYPVCALGPREAREVLDFTISDPGDPDKGWAGWDAKTPHLAAFEKHVKKGHLVQQFRAARKPERNFVHTCDACKGEFSNMMEFHVTYQTEPRRYCNSCIALTEEEEKLEVNTHDMAWRNSDN
jgi:hypothetical protein